METSVDFDLRGETLSSLSYVTVPEDPGLVDFDVVDFSVTLTFESGRHQAISWRMREGDGYISFSEALTGPDGLIHLVNASARCEHLLGKEVSDQAISLWDSSHGPLPWSLRLSFDGGGVLVVALGERDENGAPDYFPDSLIVTSSETLARTYFPAGARSSAWGLQSV